MKTVIDRRKLLLVVDDEEGMRDTLCDILEDMDFDVHLACNGREAVDKAISQAYALVLMDVKMPEMDGVAALRVIRRHRPHLPVMMMTAYANTEALDEARQIGATAIFTKPLNLMQVLASIEDVLAHAQMGAS